jgi:hypothetical protein
LFGAFGKGGNLSFTAWKEAIGKKKEGAGLRNRLFEKIIGHVTADKRRMAEYTDSGGEGLKQSLFKRSLQIR